MTDHNVTSISSALKLDTQRRLLASMIVKHVHGEGDMATAIDGVHLYRRSESTACNSAAYDPKFIVCVQGEKQINLGEQTLTIDGTCFLLTSIDLPVISKVIRATAEEPMLCLMMDLDMPVVREILAQQEVQPCPDDAACARGMTVGRTTEEMFDACIRLVQLLDKPVNPAFLADLIKRELIYRLLCGPQGKHLRAIATLGEQTNRTAKAVAWLRDNFSRPVRIEELAEVAQMGVSTFHHHFRSLTAMSPLQYQKQLRLHTARMRMLTDGLDAASAAFEVGYESPSQFSREYSRFFGQPPMRDVKSQRVASVLAG